MQGLKVRIVAPIYLIDTICKISQSFSKITDYFFCLGTYSYYFFREITMLVSIENIEIIELMVSNFFSQVFQTKLLVQLRWLDPRLEYGSKCTTPVISIPQEMNVINEIWMPQIYFTAARESLIPHTNRDISVQILPDGTIIFSAQ